MKAKLRFIIIIGIVALIAGIAIGQITQSPSNEQVTLTPQVKAVLTAFNISKVDVSEIKCDNPECSWVSFEARAGENNRRYHFRINQSLKTSEDYMMQQRKTWVMKFIEEISKNESEQPILSAGTITWK